jgi:hypothetical protein
MRLPTTPPFVWLAQGLLALSWTIVTTGIADHLLLTRLMKRQRDAIALPAGRAGEVDPR